LMLAGWLWFLGMLVPMIGLVQVGRQALADRYAYAPYVGLGLMLAAALPIPIAADSRLRRRWTAGVVVACCLLAGLTIRQAQFWRNQESLFLRQADVYPDDGENDIQLGAHYADRKLDDLALQWTDVGLSKSPRDCARALAHYNRGLIAYRRDDWPLSVAELERAMQLMPTMLECRLFLGAAYLDVGRPADAIPQLEYFLERKPNVVDGWCYLGIACVQTTRIEAARACFRRALRIDPTHPQARHAIALLGGG